MNQIDRTAPSCKFFNFGNDETYHVFQWLVRNPDIDVNRLVQDAYNSAVDNDEFAFWDLLHNALIEELAEKILEIVTEAIDRSIPQELEGQYVWLWEHEDYMKTVYANAIETQNPVDLLAPLVSHALARVDYASVAEAILLETGHYRPDITIPEAI